MKYLLLVLISINSYADYKGEGFGTTEAQASDRAWTQAVTQMAIAEHPEIVELTSYSNERLKGSDAAQSVVVHIERLDLSGLEILSKKVVPIENGYKATLTVGGKLRLTGKAEPEAKEKPFHYAKTLGKPKIRIGMSKAELLLKFGEPENVTTNYYGMTFIYFKGKMCKYDGVECIAVIRNDVVTKHEHFNFKYTEDLK